MKFSIMKANEILMKLNGVIDVYFDPHNAPYLSQYITEISIMNSIGDFMTLNVKRYARMVF